MRTLTELKELIKIESTKAYNFKTKQARTKAWARVRALSDEACMILYKQASKYGPQSMRGTVKTFNSGNDEFLVETPYGSMWVSPANDILTKSWYSHTCCIEYTVGQQVIIEFTTEVDTDKYSLRIIPGHISGGTVNETQYAELCKRDDLAFFKYPGKSGVTGLFAQSKAVSHE